MKTCARGVTMVELVTVIVVIGLAIPTLLLMWQNLAYRAGRTEAMVQAGFYAQELMEEIRAQDFDGVDSFDGYSDFCDNQGTCDSSSGRPFQRSVSVGYAELSGNVWGDSVNPTDYKRVEVSVSHQFVGQVRSVTVISAF
ncbi:type II secretion system protein [Candidatus Omnitrophota bacterium]